MIRTAFYWAFQGLIPAIVIVGVSALMFFVTATNDDFAAKKAREAAWQEKSEVVGTYPTATCKSFNADGQITIRCEPES